MRRLLFSLGASHVPGTPHNKLIVDLRLTFGTCDIWFGKLNIASNQQKIHGVGVFLLFAYYSQKKYLSGAVVVSDHPRCTTAVDGYRTKQDQPEKSLP